MGHAVHNLLWYWFAGVCFTHGGGWDFCTDMWVWIFMRIFWCGFFGCGFLVRGADFFRGFWGADFFADFVMACADFGVRIFSADFLGCFPAEKALKKSHQKIPPKNPHQRSSPRSVSSQYTTTLLLAKHSRSPQRFWVQMHLVENRFSLRRWRLSGRMSV